MHSLAPSLIAFVVAAGIVTIAPGLDSVLVLRTAASDGLRAAFVTGLGIGSGCLVWAIIVALGLGALIDACHLAYDLLRWAGAAYLLWLGLRLLHRPRRHFNPELTAPRAGRAAFARGALTNLLNPKVGVFYVSFLPQFVPADVAVAPYVLMLGAIHVLEGLAWFVCLILATRSLSRWLQRSAVVTWLDRITGGVFVAFGVGLALESRRL